MSEVKIQEQDGKSGYLEENKEFGKLEDIFVLNVLLKLLLITVFRSKGFADVVYSMLQNRKKDDLSGSPPPNGKVTETGLNGQLEERARAKSFTSAAERKWRASNLGMENAK
jgi:hypothetical protein